MDSRHQPDTYTPPEPLGVIVEPYRGALQASPSKRNSAKLDDVATNAMLDQPTSNISDAGSDNLTRWALLGEILGLVAAFVLLFNTALWFRHSYPTPLVRFVLDNIPVFFGFAAFIISIVTYRRRQQSIDPETVRIRSIVGFIASELIVFGTILQLLGAIGQMFK